MIDLTTGHLSQARKHGEIMKKRNSGERTFAFAVNKWLEKPSEKNGRTKAKNYAQKGDFFKQLWGSKQIEDISDRDVAKLIAELRAKKNKDTGKPYSESGINNYAGVYSAVMKNAVENLKLIQVFPKWKKLQEIERQYYPEPHQIKVLHDELMSMGDQNTLRADMVAFCFHTQVRNAIATNLKIEEISHDLSFMAVPAHKMKNNQPFERPLNAEAKKIVQRNIERGYALQEKYSWLDPIDYVFVQDAGKRDSIGKPFSKNGLVNKQWRLARERAGLPKDFVFHSLRHAGATFLVREGIDMKMVSTLLGHASEKSTWRYRHISTKESQQASELTSGVSL